MREEATAILGKMHGVKVLCVGDVMLDRYIYGNAQRISPEAPVPVVHVQRQVLIPGGVGNVAKNLEALGVFPMTVSVVGNDANADLLSGFLSGDGGSSISLLRDESRPTIVKTRVIAGIQQLVRFDDERIAPLSDEATDKIVDIVERLLDEVGAVAVSDYGKGVMNPRLTRKVIRLASERGLPVVIDPKGRDYSKYEGAFLVKPNRKELAEASGYEVDDFDVIAAAGRALMRTHGIKNLLVTLSDQGMMLFKAEDGGNNPMRFPSRAREVFDVTGAGDTVLAGVAASLALGAPLELGARLATLAAGVVVGKVGTAVATPGDIERAAKEGMNSI